MIKIREAESKDSKIILNCIKGLAEHVNQIEMVTATEKDIKNTIFKQDSHVKVFVAENTDQEICGFALIYRTYSTFKARTNYFIEDLFIFPEHRKLGIGLTLFNFIRDYARRQGADKIK